MGSWSLGREKEWRRASVRRAERGVTKDGLISSLSSSALVAPSWVAEELAWVMARPAPCREVSSVHVADYDTYGVALVELAPGVELGAAWTCAGPCAAPRGTSACRTGLERISECTGLALCECDYTRGVQDEVVRDFWKHRRDYKLVVYYGGRHDENEGRKQSDSRAIKDSGKTGSRCRASTQSPWQSPRQSHPTYAPAGRQIKRHRPQRSHDHPVGMCSSMPGGA